MAGWIEIVLMRIVDIFLSIPPLVLAIAMMGVLEPTLTNAMLAVTLMWWTWYARLVYSIARGEREEVYVVAAEVLAASTWHIIFREILPNALSPLVAEMGLRFIFAVLFISTLSFLGLGIQPPQADLGGIVKENTEGLTYGIGAALWPAMTIAVLAISVNLVADWILNRTTSLKGGRG